MHVVSALKPVLIIRKKKRPKPDIITVKCLPAAMLIRVKQWSLTSGAAVPMIQTKGKEQKTSPMRYISYVRMIKSGL
ncbi:hypothetical protein D3C80_1799380 [compost metagenome]